MHKGQTDNVVDDGETGEFLNRLNWQETAGTGMHYGWQ